MSGVLVNKLYDFKGHRDCVYALEKSDSPTRLFSADGNGMVVEWNTDHPDQGSLIAKVPHSVYALHYLADRNILVVGHNQDGIHFIDVESKKEIASLKMTTTSIFDIQSFDHWLFVGTGDGSLFVIDLNTYKSHKHIQASTQSVRCIAINPSTQEMAVGYSDFFIRIFSLDDFSMKKEIEAHDNSVFALRYSSDHKYLISGSRDARLKQWDASNQYMLHHSVPAHLYAINHLVFSPDGKHFITCSSDKTIKVWNAEDLKLLKVIDRARHSSHATSVNKVLWLSEHRIVSASDDRNVYVWDIHFENLKKIIAE